MYLNIILEYYVELLCVADDGVAMNGGEWLVGCGGSLRCFGGKCCLPFIRNRVTSIDFRKGEKLQMNREKKRNVDTIEIGSLYFGIGLIMLQALFCIKITV